MESFCALVYEEAFTGRGDDAEVQLDARHPEDLAIIDLRGYVPRRYRDAGWSEKFFLAHIFDHPMYRRHDGLVRSPTADPP